MGKISDSAILEQFPQIRDIQNARIRQAVLAIWQEVFEAGKWDSLDGPRFNLLTPDIALVEHTRCVTDGAIALARASEMHFGTKIDYDVLIASCILHDVSKVLEMEPCEGGAQKSQIGKTYQHAFFSAYYAKKHDLPDEIVTTVLTHTGFSKTLPSTREGVILFYADMADADMHRFEAGAPLNIAHHK